ATKTDGNLKVTTYGYDASNRLTSVTFQDGTSYLYDSKGNRILEQGPSHERILAYDELNRVAQVNDITLGKTLAYGYDANGNRTSLTEGSLSFGYAYDNLNRLKRVTDSLGQSSFFDYDLDGRRSAVTRPNGVTTTYTYDAASQLTQMVHSKAGNVLLGFAYAYDGQGNRVSKTREDGSQELYTYDAGNRLTDVQYGTSRTVNYSLDDTGNRYFLVDSSNGITTKVRSTFNTFNQLTRSVQITPGSATTDFAYDANGNLLSETTGTQVKQYTWDLDNRLKQVTLPSLLNTFAYDATGLRIQKVDSTGTTKYVLDGASVLEELNATGGTTTSYLTNPQAIDEIESFQQAGATYYPLSDALGSIYGVTNSSGSVVATWSYDVYGKRTQ